MAVTGWEIPAAALIVALVGMLGGWVWNLATRLAKSEAISHAAEIMASNATAKATILERDLTEHREHVAAEYLSKGAMAEITAAINRLGDRLDGLFIHFLPRP